MGILVRLRRWLSTAGFGLAIALFFLPMATMSVCGQTLKPTGVDLAVVAPSLLVHHAWFSAAGAYLVFDLVPLLALIGLVVQALSGRLLAFATLGLSVVGFAALVADGFILPRAGQAMGSALQTDVGISAPTLLIIAGQDWRWQPAFYAAAAAILLPAIPSAAEALRSRRGAAIPHGPLVVASARVGGIVALIGALATLVGGSLPFARYGDSFGGPTAPSIFNGGYPGSQWFAPEPVAVMALGIAAGVVLVAGRPRTLRLLAAGMLIALGVQTFCMFMGYASLGPYNGTNSQIGIGSFAGMVGGLCLLAGGAVGAANREPKAVAAPA